MHNYCLYLTYLLCILLCIILEDIIVNCKINIQDMANKSCIKDKILYIIMCKDEQNWNNNYSLNSTGCVTIIITLNYLNRYAFNETYKCTLITLLLTFYCECLCLIYKRFYSLYY